MNKQNNNKFACLIVCLQLMFVGCTTTGTMTGTKTANLPDDELQTDTQLHIIKPEKKTAFISRPVIRNLLKRAKLRSEVMDYEAAVHLLERGIAISPNDPILWQEIAAVRLSQGDFEQATQLARKSNVLAEADEKLRSTNMNIIKEANRGKRVQRLGGTVLH